MTNILGKDNAFWKNQFNRIAWIAPFFCRCFIGSFRCIPSLAAFVWLVSSVSFDQRFAVAQNATPDIDVQFAADQTANFQRTEIQVLDPDGNIAKNAKYVCGDSIVVELNGSFEIIGPAHRGRVIISAKQLNDDGMLPMRHEPNSTFVAVWNEKGFYQASIARLPATKSIQLKKWASLEITAMADGKPDDGVNLVITSHLTSDGLFQGLEFKIRDLADRNGKAKFPMIAPGEINIQSDVKQETVGFVTKLSYGRSKTVFIEAGSKVRVQVGGTGRKVSGNLSFIESNPLLHFGLLQGEIRCREAGESIPIRILDDGTFDCDDVPFGECTVHIRNSGSQSPNKGVAVKIFTGIKIFACSDDKSGELAIGTIPVEERVLVNPTLAEPSKVIVNSQLVFGQLQMLSQTHLAEWWHLRICTETHLHQPIACCVLTLRQRKLQM